MTDTIGAGGGRASAREGGEDPVALVDGADEDGVEPVELLVQLADEGEIDPWDIDIVAVTDKFLARLDDADLRASGRALFYASVLLRMKSDALIADPEPEEAEPERPPDPWGPDAPGEGPGDHGPLHDPIDALESEMERRLDRKRARGTPDTLDELVRELRERERGSWWKESREYETDRERPLGPQNLEYAVPEPRDDGRGPSAAVAETAHEERMDDTKAAVQRALNEHFDRGRDEVLFAEIRDAGGSPVETFLGLLFLTNEAAVRLEQDDLFGDLWIRDPSAGSRLADAAD
jgi:segregation and condensation protein A